MDSAVNQRIKIVRKDLNLTQIEFSNTIGITQTSLSQIEKEKNGISFEVFSAIVNNYYINPYWLMNGEGEMYDKKRKMEMNPDDKDIIQATGLTNNEFYNAVVTRSAKFNFLINYNPKVGEAKSNLTNFKTYLLILNSFTESYIDKTEEDLERAVLQTEPEQLNISTLYKNYKKQLHFFIVISNIISKHDSSIKVLINDLRQVDNLGLITDLLESLDPNLINES